MKTMRKRNFAASSMNNLTRRIVDHLHRIWGLALKEFQQLSRDKLLLAFLIIAPLMELLLMGALAGGGIRNLPLAVVDQDRTRASRDLVAKLEQRDEFRIMGYGDSVEEARSWMQGGDVSAIAVIRPGYGAALTDPVRSAQVQIIADGSNQVASTVTLAASEDVAAELSRDLVASHQSAGKGPVELRIVARFNAAMEDQPHSITAMLAIIVFEIALVVAAQSIARERENGTLEQLRVTPLGRLDLMIGKALPTLVVGLVDFLLLVGLVVIWFDIPVRGSVFVLTLLTIPFVIAQIGWGTLISLISRTQQQAMLFVFALAMVEVAFSGFLVPASDMPGIMQAVSYVSSLQHYLVIVRGIALRGASLRTLWVPAVSLAGISAGVLMLAWLRLRIGLDSDSLRQRLVRAWRHLGARWSERPSRSRPDGHSAKKRELKREPA